LGIGNNYEKMGIVGELRNYGREQNYGKCRDYGKNDEL
jgi:hypothetical protein